VSSQDHLDRVSVVHGVVDVEADPRSPCAFRCNDPALLQELGNLIVRSHGVDSGGRRVDTGCLGEGSRTVVEPRCTGRA